MTSQSCDHTSVGMLVWKGSFLLLINRKRPPYGYAAPAGHVDGDRSYEAAAVRELSEEVGLNVERLTLVFEKVKANPCRREGGSWHHWKVYEVSVSGELHPSQDEAREADWFDLPKVKLLAGRTEMYRSGQISSDEWYRSPGLEPVWQEILVEIGIIESQQP